MRLGAARGAADAVAAGAPAEQDDLVAGLGLLAAHVARGRGAHHGADLHALGHVARVVELGDLPRGEADLVAVAGVAGGGGRHELALRQLAGERLGDRHRGVGRAGHAHGLVDVAAAGERVADGAADAGRRAAEGLDLGRVVVGLVLEEEEPVLILAVDVDRDLDRAGVDLLGLVEAGELPGVLEPLGADGAHVHEADGLPVAAELVADLEVAVEGRLDHGVVDLDLVEHGAERGVAAVVRPVGVDDADLGDRGVAALLGEVLLAEADVGEVHGQPALGDEGGEAGLVELAEAVEDLDGLGIGNLGGEGLGLLERGEPRLDRVHHVVRGGVDGALVERALDEVDLCGAHGGALALGDELDALARGVGALVELAGQELDGEGRRVLGLRELVVGDVDLRLAEHGGDAGAEELLVDALDIVAVDEPEARDALDAEDARELALELLGLDVEARFLLHVDARDHGSCPSLGWLHTVSMIRQGACAQAPPREVHEVSAADGRVAASPAPCAARRGAFEQEYCALFGNAGLAPAFASRSRRILLCAAAVSGVAAIFRTVFLSEHAPASCSSLQTARVCRRGDATRSSVLAVDGIETSG